MVAHSAKRKALGDMAVSLNIGQEIACSPTEPRRHKDSAAGATAQQQVDDGSTLYDYSISNINNQIIVNKIIRPKQTKGSRSGKSAISPLNIEKFKQELQNQYNSSPRKSPGQLAIEQQQMNNPGREPVLVSSVADGGVAGPQQVPQNEIVVHQIATRNTEIWQSKDNTLCSPTHSERKRR